MWIERFVSWGGFTRLSHTDPKRSLKTLWCEGETLNLTKSQRGKQNLVWKRSPRSLYGSYSITLTHRVRHKVFPFFPRTWFHSSPIRVAAFYPSAVFPKPCFGPWARHTNTQKPLSFSPAVIVGPSWHQTLKINNLSGQPLSLSTLTFSRTRVVTFVSFTVALQTHWITADLFSLDEIFVFFDPWESEENHDTQCTSIRKAFW